MNDFNGFSAKDIEEKIIQPHGGLDYFILVTCPGYKIPACIAENGAQMDLVIEDDDLNDATVKYLEYRRVTEIDWRQR